MDTRLLHILDSLEDDDQNATAFTLCRETVGRGFQVGAIRTDATEYGWIDTIGQSPELYSYVMNNYWETNYKAGQEGLSMFRYSIHQHGPFDPLEVEKIGRESFHPLLLKITDGLTETSSQGWDKMTIPGVIVENMIPLGGQEILLRLYNPGGDIQKISFDALPGKKKVYLSDPFGNNRQQIESDMTLPGRVVLHVVVSRQTGRSEQ